MSTMEHTSGARREHLARVRADLAALAPACADLEKRCERRDHDEEIRPHAAKICVAAARILAVDALEALRVLWEAPEGAPQCVDVDLLCAPCHPDYGVSVGDMANLLLASAAALEPEDTSEWVWPYVCEDSDAARAARLDAARLRALAWRIKVGE